MTLQDRPLVDQFLYDVGADVLLLDLEDHSEDGVVICTLVGILQGPLQIHRLLLEGCHPEQDHDPLLDVGLVLY